jgi:hypothetical protein
VPNTTPNIVLDARARSAALKEKYGHLSRAESQQLIAQKAEVNAESWVRNYEANLGQSYPGLNPHFVDNPPQHGHPHAGERGGYPLYPGHANMNTTEIYTQVSIKKLKEVHTLTHPRMKRVNPRWGAKQRKQKNPVPRPCWTPWRGKGRTGNDWWRSGKENIMQSITLHYAGEALWL